MVNNIFEMPMEKYGDYSEEIIEDILSVCVTETISNPTNSESIWDDDNQNQVESSSIILDNIQSLSSAATRNKLDHSYALPPDSEPMCLWRLVLGNKDNIDHTYAMGYWEKVSLSEVITEAEIQQQLLFTCNKCPMSFSEKSLLTQHIKDIHTVVTLLQCNRCGQTFCQQNQLKMHQREFQEQSVIASFYDKFQEEINGHQIYQCDLCTFSIPIHCYGLISFQHHYNLHFTEFGVMCNKCPKKFRTLAALKAHLDIIHQQVNNHCFECGKTFQYLSNLTRVQTPIQFLHNKSKKLRCPECDKTHSMVKQTMTFKQKKRKQVQENICPICNKVFKTKKYFILHCSKKHNMMLKVPQFCYPLPGFK